MRWLASAWASWPRSEPDDAGEAFAVGSAAAFEEESVLMTPIVARPEGAKNAALAAPALAA
jgi:hypothetical protein